MHEHIFQAWACVIGDAQVTYLSGPITTGRRFVDAVRAGAPLSDVLRSNLDDLAETAATLRTRLGTIVVDPSPLMVKHWSQDDYMTLWKGLIERHARDVRFMPGWQYSLGCTREFAHATSLGIATRHVGGAELNSAAAKALIAAAAAQVGAAVGEKPALGALADGLRAEADALPGDR